MNETLKTATKNILKGLLLKCTERQQEMFKLMYGRNGGKRSVEDSKKMDINDVVDEMDSDRYDTAISQCERTVEKNSMDRFKLLIPFNGYKVGDIFESFGGLVSGVDDISFTNKEYFILVK